MITANFNRLAFFNEIQCIRFLEILSKLNSSIINFREILIMSSTSLEVALRGETNETELITGRGSDGLELWLL